MSLVVPAVLPSSHKDLGERLSLFASLPFVNRVQIDIVDGKFAAPASWPYFAKATQGTPYSELKQMVADGYILPYLDHFEYEIDLMCLDAERVAEDWLSIGATRLIFHAESVTDLPRFFRIVRSRYGAGTGFAPGLISFGLALNIESDLALIEQCISEIAFVQFMGIARIGRQGEPFDNRVLEKIRILHSRHPELPIQIDGGVSLANAKQLIKLGATNLVVGSALLHSSNPYKMIAEFDAFQSPYGV